MPIVCQAFSKRGSLHEHRLAACDRGPWTIHIQGVLGLHEFWAREKLMKANFVPVTLCTSSFVKLRAGEIFSTCYPRNGLCLKIRASEISASQGLLVHNMRSVEYFVPL